MRVYIFYLGSPGSSVFKTSKQPKTSGVEGGGLLRPLFRLLYRCFLDFQDKRYRLASYLMEQIYFEAQLCSKTSIFKEKHVLDILINLCLATGLPFGLEGACADRPTIELQAAECEVVATRGIGPDLLHLCNFQARRKRLYKTRPRAIELRDLIYFSWFWIIVDDFY